MVYGALSRVGTRIGATLSKSPWAAGVAGFGLGEATDWFGIDLAEGGGGDGPLSNITSGPTVLWIFAGIALLAVVADLQGDN